MLTPVDPSETLSRFILQSNWYRTSDNTVKYAAFMPNPKDNKTSVFRTSGVSNDDIWNIGDREVSARLGKPILGRADIYASNVTERDLEVIPSEPPEKHANITSWPQEASKQKVIAIELASEARFHKK
jgi:hypothetical protein